MHVEAVVYTRFRALDAGELPTGSLDVMLSVDARRCMGRRSDVLGWRDLG